MIDIGDARRAAIRHRASALLAGEDDRARAAGPCNIYLLDALADDELVAGVRQLIEEAGYSVFLPAPDPSDSGDEATSLDQVCVDGMARCGMMFLAFRPHLPLAAQSAWQLGFFDAMTAPQARIFLLPILEEGEMFEAAGLLARYPLADLAAHRSPMAYVLAETRSDRNWLRRLIGDRYPELRCRAPF